MSDFNWVDARSLCSLSKVFQRLVLEIQSDVDKRNAKRSATPYYEFSAIAKDSYISVMVSGNGVAARHILFKLGDNSISVHDDQNQLLIDATLTLGDDGECRFKVKDQEKEFWQFRRMALEKLFFESIPREG